MNQNKNNKKLKQESIKIQFIKYVLPIYLCIVGFLLICYLSSFSVDTSENFGGFAIIGHVLVFIILLVIVSSILSFILSFKNIKNNYDNLYKSDIKKVMLNVFNSFLLYNIVSVIISRIVISIYGRTISLLTYGVFFEPIYYILFTPLIMPIVSFFNKDNYVSKNHAKMVLIFYVLISGLLCVLRFSTSTRFYTNIVLLFPYTIMSLQNKSKDAKKINNTDIISFVILVALYCAISVF